MECFHGLLQVNHPTGTPAIKQDAHVLYGAVVVDDEPHGYLKIGTPVGETDCHWQTQQFKISESIHTAIRLFKKDNLIFRLHDADPNKALDDSHINPDLKTMVTATLQDFRKEQEAASSGNDARDIQVYEGYRTVARQDTLYAKGRTAPGEPCTHNGVKYSVGSCPTNQHPLGKTVTNATGSQLQSWHQFGIAVDIVFCNKNGGFDWGSDKDWDALGQAGKNDGLHWGGDWTKPDTPHFQATTHDSPRQADKDTYNNTQGTDVQKLQAVWAGL